MAEPGIDGRDRSEEIDQLHAYIQRLESLAIRMTDAATEAERIHADRTRALEKWIKEREDHISSVEMQNEELRRTVTDLLSSTSWRITAPLRWLREKFG